MNLSDIEAFIMIIETGSLSNAAKKLFISQSTISSKLINLENEIGHSLIERNQGVKEIKLTQKGIEFLEYANRYVSLKKDIELWKENNFYHIIKLSLPHSLNSYLLKPFFYSYLTNADIKLSISSHWNSTIYNMLNNKQLDLGLVSRPFSSQNLITEFLFFEEMVFIFNKKSNYFENFEIKNLPIEKEIYLDWGPDFELWHQENFLNQAFPKVKVDTPNLIEEFINFKNNWAIVPKYIAFEFQKSNKNLRIINNSFFPKRKIYLVKQKKFSNLNNEVIEKFINHLKEFLKSNQYINY